MPSEKSGGIKFVFTHNIGIIYLINKGAITWQQQYMIC